MSDPAKFSLDPALAKLVQQVQSNTEKELSDLRQLPPKFTRATGMVDPDLDLSPIRYEPEKH